MLGWQTIAECSDAPIAPIAPIRAWAKEFQPRHVEKDSTAIASTLITSDWLQNHHSYEKSHEKSPLILGKSPEKSYDKSHHWMMETHQILNGYDIWLVATTPLKNMKVSWDDIPDIWKNKKKTNHQPDVDYD